MIIDLLWGLREQDRVEPRMWGPVYGQITASDTATVVRTSQASFDAIIPDGLALLLTGVVVFANPGSTYTVNEIAGEITLADGTVLSHLFDGDPSGGSGESVYREWQGEALLLKGDHSLVVAGLFSAGASANAITMHYQGYVIPHGNSGAF